MLTVQEITKLSDQELRKELTKAQRELVKLKMTVKMGQEKATHKVRNMKKYVARLNTVIGGYAIEVEEKEEVNV